MLQRINQVIGEVIDRSRLHLLSCLVAVESQASPSAFHDDCRTESAQHTSLVIFTRVEGGEHSIIVVRELCAAGWTRSLGVCSTGEAENVGATSTEDVTSMGQ